MKYAPVAVVLLGLFLVSCQTGPAAVPADATSEIYFQRAQAASDLSQYDEALAIYRSFLTQRADAPNEQTFSARYEIALLLLKKGQVAQAQADFEGILADYDVLEKSAGAPGWVKVLSAKKLQELKDKAPKAKV
jgi:tetratricopeptide (TPR) repeat protein